MDFYRYLKLRGYFWKEIKGSKRNVNAYQIFIDVMWYWCGLMPGKPNSPLQTLYPEETFAGKTWVISSSPRSRNPNKWGLQCHVGGSVGQQWWTAHTYTIFWTCPLIKPFWEEVPEIIYKTLEWLHVIPHPASWTPKDLNPSHTYLLKVLVAASKRTITKCWPQKQCLPVDAIINTANQLDWKE